MQQHGRKDSPWRVRRPAADYPRARSGWRDRRAWLEGPQLQDRRPRRPAADRPYPGAGPEMLVRLVRRIRPRVGPMGAGGGRGQRTAVARPDDGRPELGSAGARADDHAEGDALVPAQLRRWQRELSAHLWNGARRPVFLLVGPDPGLRSGDRRRPPRRGMRTRHRFRPRDPHDQQQEAKRSAGCS